MPDCRQVYLDHWAYLMSRDGYLVIASAKKECAGNRVESLRTFGGDKVTHPFIVQGRTTKAEWKRQSGNPAPPDHRYFYKVLTD